MRYSRNNQSLSASQRQTEAYDPRQRMNACANKGGRGEGGVCKERNQPQSITDILCNIISEQLEVTTPFGVLTGILLDVKNDYIIVLEDNGDQVLVRTGEIESVSPLT